MPWSPACAGLWSGVVENCHSSESMIYGGAGADPPRRACPGCYRRACDDAATRVQSCQLQQSVPLSLPSNPGCFMSRLLGDRVRSQRPRCRESAEFTTNSYTENHTLMRSGSGAGADPSSKVQTPRFWDSPPRREERPTWSPGTQSQGRCMRAMWTRRPRSRGGPPLPSPCGRRSLLLPRSLCCSCSS